MSSALVFPLRRLFIDADAELDDSFLDVVVFLEIIAFLFIVVAIKVLFAREMDSAKHHGKKQTAREAMPVSGPRNKGV